MNDKALELNHLSEKLKTWLSNLKYNPHLQFSVFLIKAPFAMVIANGAFIKLNLP
jgi:hypothetical protein